MLVILNAFIIQKSNSELIRNSHGITRDSNDQVKTLLMDMWYEENIPLMKKRVRQMLKVSERVSDGHKMLLRKRGYVYESGSNKRDVKTGMSVHLLLFGTKFFFLACPHWTLTAEIAIVILEISLFKIIQDNNGNWSLWPWKSFKDTLWKIISHKKMIHFIIAFLSVVLGRCLKVQENNWNLISKSSSKCKRKHFHNEDGSVILIYLPELSFSCLLFMLLMYIKINIKIVD